MLGQPMPACQAQTWPQGPSHPRLAQGELEIWWADLATASDEVLTSLSADERRRSDRFPNTQDGLLWARSRGVLRALLSRYEKVEPATVVLRLGRNGKPALATPERDPHVAFNLSHSGPLALYAFSRAGPVGVDAQRAPVRAIDHAAIAARLLGAWEGRRLSQLDPAERQREFLRMWSRTEAALKCRGSGLGDVADVLADHPYGEAADAGLWVAQLELGIGAAGAVALEHAPREQRYWSWSAQARLPVAPMVSATLATAVVDGEA
jgi:4'-phosphopantetheinyl transferase